MVDFVHTPTAPEKDRDVSEAGYKRYGVYFDKAMLDDERVIQEQLKREGVKANRSAAVRRALKAEANRIRRQQRDNARKSGG